MKECKVCNKLQNLDQFHKNNIDFATKNNSFFNSSNETNSLKNISIIDSVSIDSYIDQKKQDVFLVKKLQDTKQKILSESLDIVDDSVVSKFMLYSTLHQELIEKDGEELIPQSDIYLTRDMDFSVSTPSAAEQLEILLFTDMRQDVSSQILRRLSYLGNKKPVTP